MTNDTLQIDENELIEDHLDEEEPPSRDKRSTRLLLILSISLVGLAAVYLVGNSDGFNESHDTVTYNLEQLGILPSSTDKQKERDRTTDYDPDQIDKLINRELDRAPTESNAIESLQEGITTIKASLATLIKNSNNIDKRLENDKSNTTRITQKLDNALQTNRSLSKHIDNNRQAITVLDEKLSGINNTLLKIVKRLPKQKKKIANNRALKPPFSLVSIDRWGNDDSAVLMMRGKTKSVITGEIAAGWRISHITKPSCITAVSTSSHNKKEICIGQ